MPGAGATPRGCTIEDPKLSDHRVLIGDFEITPPTPPQQFVLPRAHSHNDQEHARVPMLSALQAGYVSVEVDVQRDLRIGHDHGDAWQRTLGSHYLTPLADRVHHRGWVLPGRTFTLVVETKQADMTDDIVRALQPYRWMLSRFESGRLVHGPVRVVLTGAVVDKDLVSQDDDRIAFLDGSSQEAQRYAGVAVVNIDFKTMARGWGGQYWAGKSAISEQDFSGLASLVRAAHVRGQDVRVFGYEESRYKTFIWEALADAGVDYLATNRLDDAPQYDEQLVIGGVITVTVVPRGKRAVIAITNRLGCATITIRFSYWTGRPEDVKPVQVCAFGAPVEVPFEAAISARLRTSIINVPVERHLSLASVSESRYVLASELGAALGSDLALGERSPWQLLYYGWPGIMLASNGKCLTATGELTMAPCDRYDLRQRWLSDGHLRNVATGAWLGVDHRRPRLTTTPLTRWQLEELHE